MSESTHQSGTSDRPRKRRRRRKPPGGKPKDTAPQQALRGSRIDAAKPVDQPLTGPEIAEMKRHLRFLASHRKALRLRVNAAEDLLLNGAKEPEHRGTCLHLLGKVDLASAESAVTRFEDPQARVELLAGIVRFSSDLGILLLYLESLAETSSKRQAAGAFSHAVARIDFATVSDARMRRLLELVATIFDGHERVQVLFGLLQSESFRTTFERSADALPESLAELFVPLSCVHEVVFAGRHNTKGSELLEKGIALLLEAPDEALRAYPLAVRERLLEKAVRLAHDEGLRDRASRALLDSLPDESRAFSNLGMLRAAELLRRHDDDEARKILNRIRSAHSGFLLPARWLSALAAPRVARLALVQPERDEKPEPRDEKEQEAGERRGRRRRRRKPAEDAAPQAHEGLREAFWLDAQQHVWLRTGEAGSGDHFGEEVNIQRGLPMSGVLPVACSGTADDGTPYVASPAFAFPLTRLLSRGRWRRDHAFGLAMQGVQLVHSLAVAGVELPDLDPKRFMAQDGRVPALWLADFTGARRAHGVPDLRELGASWCESVFEGLRDEDVPPDLRDEIARRPGLPELIAALAARV
jgi:hypothetical protein